MALEELFKSVNRLSWAISLLAFQQLGNTMSSLFSRQNDYRNPDRSTTPSLRGSGNSGGDPMQREISLQPTAVINPFDSRNVFRMGIQLLHQSADLFKTLNSGPENRMAWQELQNKLEAFSLFEHVDLELNISQPAPEPLAELIARARSQESYRSVWLMEGLGHYYSDSRLRRREIPSVQDEGLETASLVPLHAGMGLSVAEWFLPSMEQNPAASVRTFIEICKASSRSGYVGVSCEALGLATRNLYPHLLLPIDGVLSAMGEELMAYFWHGAGRAIYFSPSNFLPWRAAPWQGLQSCLHESPHLLGRKNAVAGFCWALTLVNIRQPEVIETFLRHHAAEFTENDAGVNGIGSALAIWVDATSCPQCLDPLRQYQPVSSMAALWRSHVQESCEQALQRHDTLHTQSAIGELFRYQNTRDAMQGKSLHDTPEIFTGIGDSPERSVFAGTPLDAIISRAAHDLLRPQPAQRQQNREISSE